MRQRTQGRGEVRADALYPVSIFLRRLGIGRHSLTSLRKQGLPCHAIGTRLFIDGAEALSTLRRLWAEQRIDDALSDARNTGENRAAVPPAIPTGQQ